MQYETRGKTLQEAVGKAVGRKRYKVSQKNAISNTHLTCGQISSHIRRLQSEVEQSLDAMEALVEEVEDRTRTLGNDARNAAAGLVVDIALVAFGVSSMLVAIRSFKAASAIGGSALIAADAMGLSRDLSSGFSRLGALGEWIDIRSVQGQVDRHMDRVVRHARTLDQLWERYTTLRCDRR